MRSRFIAVRSGLDVFGDNVTSLCHLHHEFLSSLSPLPRCFYCTACSTTPRAVFNASVSASNGPKLHRWRQHMHHLTGVIYTPNGERMNRNDSSTDSLARVARSMLGCDSPTPVKACLTFYRRSVLFFRMFFASCSTHVGGKQSMHRTAMSATMWTHAFL